MSLVSPREAPPDDAVHTGELAPRPATMPSTDPRTRRLAGLWVRGALRRPGRGLLVVGGLLTMALVVTAALAASAALERVFVADAHAQWGDTDVVVASPGGALMDEGLGRLLGVEGAHASEAWATRLILPTIAQRGEEREPRARLLGVNAEERGFGAPLAGRGLVDPVALGPDEVVLNERLAGRLGADVGDRLELIVAVPHTEYRNRAGDLQHERPAEAVAWEVSIAGIAEDAGLADLGRTANVLARTDAVQRVTDLPGKVSGLHAAAAGDGPEASEELVAAYEDLARRVGVVPLEVKEQALEIAEDEAGQFGGIFMALAFLVVLGSVAVTINLLTLLGQERSREVALLRAAGARQGILRRLLLAEGAVYALVAAAIGGLLALPLGRWLAQLVADHFAAIELGRGREFVDLSMDVPAGTVAAAVLVVTAVALVAVGVAARRVAALDVEEVLRGQPPRMGAARPDGLRRPLLTAAAGLLLLGMGITASAAGDLLRFGGLSLLLIAGWLQARRVAGDRRRLDALAAAGGLAWFVLAPAALGDFTRGVESGFAVLALAGAGAVGCATVLVGARLRAVMWFIRGYLPAGRIQAATRTAAAWAEHDRGRAGTVIGLVGIVLFMVAAMAVLGRATAIDVDRQAGGFDVIGTSVAAADLEELRAVDGVARLVGLDHTVIGEQMLSTVDDDGDVGRLRWPVGVLRGTDELARVQAFGLADALPRYQTAGQAIEDVMQGRRAVLDRYSRPEGARPGDTVRIDLGRGPEEFELAAVLDTYLLGAVIVGDSAYDAMFPRRGPTMVLAARTAGVERTQLAAELDAAGRGVGLEARSVDEVAEEITALNAAFTDIFGWMLQAALAVALVAVAALVGRALRERRQALALTRALGFRRRDVVAMVLAEPLLLAAVGTLIGLAAGLGTLRLLFWVGFADLAFRVHWQQIGTTVAITFAVVVAGCLIPAVATAHRPLDTDLRDLG